MQYVVDSNGDRVNVGNFDENGLNVNNWNDHDRNDNLGVSSSRQFVLSKAPRYGALCVFSGFIDFIQPPSILPISSICCCMAVYFLPSMAFVS